VITCLPVLRRPGAQVRILPGAPTAGGANDSGGSGNPQRRTMGDLPDVVVRNWVSKRHHARPASNPFGARVDLSCYCGYTGSEPEAAAGSGHDLAVIASISDGPDTGAKAVAGLSFSQIGFPSWLGEQPLARSGLRSNAPGAASEHPHLIEARKPKRGAYVVADAWRDQSVRLQVENEDRGLGVTDLVVDLLPRAVAGTGFVPGKRGRASSSTSAVRPSREHAGALGELELAGLEYLAAGLLDRRSAHGSILVPGASQRVLAAVSRGARAASSRVMVRSLLPVLGRGGGAGWP
jgi:hypothetical protein